MRSLSYKGQRCTKIKFTKCKEIACLYGVIAIAYAQRLEADSNVRCFSVNVPIEADGDEKFVTDFLITYADGQLSVRECAFRKQLSLPRMCRLLDMSYAYWNKRGISDWCIIVEGDVKHGNQ